LRDVAYVDEDLKISADRNLMEPVVQARLMQELQLSRSDAVLDIASGTGYAAAVMARLAGSVFALETDAEIQSTATALFGDLALDNVVPVEGDLAAGCPEHAPYNAILIEGAVEEVPPAIFEQLADGGRLATVVIENGLGRATLFRMDRGHLSRRTLFDANVPLLKEFRAPKSFSL
jgi:protein-L-isoaspartate(D-aspartate) O-methyltransferase